jgi:hypothetical protein
MSQSLHGLTFLPLYINGETAAAVSANPHVMHRRGFDCIAVPRKSDRAPKVLLKLHK